MDQMNSEQEMEKTTLRSVFYRRVLCALLLLVLMANAFSYAESVSEKPFQYETTIGYISDLKNPDLRSLESALSNFYELGDYRLSSDFYKYVKAIIILQMNEDEIRTVEIYHEQCTMEDAKNSFFALYENKEFTEELANNGLEPCKSFLTYIRAREKEEEGDQEEAVRLYSQIPSVLDAESRARRMAVTPTPSPTDAPTPRRKPTATSTTRRSYPSLKLKATPNQKKQEVKLTWTNLGPNIQYIISWKPAGIGEKYKEIGKTKKTSFTHQYKKKAQAGKKYWYRVSAKDASGEEVKVDSTCVPIPTPTPRPTRKPTSPPTPVPTLIP